MEFQLGYCLLGVALLSMLLTAALDYTNAARQDASESEEEEQEEKEQQGADRDESTEVEEQDTGAGWREQRRRLS
eukprot:COSAG01_NODE_309_length_19142_cov_22.748149_24_plen_75_part_00